jgi:SNF2 family DNA or RNA helicase
MEKLKQNQIVAIDEAISRGLTGGGLSLPLGFGKTRTSICLGLKYNRGPILVVVSKTLLAGWLGEIGKAFGEDLKYEIMYKPYLKKNFGIWEPKPDTQLVLTTPEVLVDAYTEYHFEDLFCNHIVPEAFGPIILEYIVPTEPMLKDHSGYGYLYSVKWGCLIIDEIQTLTNVETKKCRAISCISSHYRWGLSGTMFDEPKTGRFLGYFTMLHLKGPRTIPDMKVHMKTSFTGFRRFLVHRETNEEFVKPEYVEEIVSHDLSETEQYVFECSREILNSLSKSVRDAKRTGDVNGMRTFNAYLLAMITYIRQFIISPIIPITNIYCDIADFSTKSELSEIIGRRFQELKLDRWLNSEESFISTRFKAILEKVEKHKAERTIIFSCFRTPLVLLQHILDSRGYKTLTIDAGMSAHSRKSVLEQFEQTDECILLLTYTTGAEGLNLQCASVVMLVDLWWNSAKIQQAIGRVFRPGQKKTVYAYIFISNTSMESQMIEKNKLKAEMLKELEVGKTTKRIPKLTLRQIMNIINSEHNGESLKQIRT